MCVSLFVVAFVDCCMVGCVVVFVVCVVSLLALLAEFLVCLIVCFCCLTAGWIVCVLLACLIN